MTPLPPTHPVIAKLQGDTDPTNAVREMMTGASVIAQSVGVRVTYNIEPADPNATLDPTAWQNGLRHFHSAVAMIGVRARSILTPTINKLRKLPHVPVNAPTTAPDSSNQGSS